MAHKEKLLTVDVAYDAVVDYLDKYYMHKKSESLGILLSDMQLLQDNMPADLAALGNWNESVCKIRNLAIQRLPSEIEDYSKPDYSEGHFHKSTPENVKILEHVANNKNNFLGIDKYGAEWHVDIIESKKQIWIQVRDHEIKNGGIYEPPRPFKNSAALQNNYKKQSLFLEKITDTDAFNIMVDFLIRYRDEASSEDIEILLKSMLIDIKTIDYLMNEWSNSLDTILTQNPRIRPYLTLTTDNKIYSE